jgi:hypothetical protein
MTLSPAGGSIPPPTLDKSESRSADLDGFTILAVVTIPRLWDLKKVGALP